MKLGLDFSFQDLHTAQGLRRLDEHFVTFLRDQDQPACDRLVHYRQQQDICSETILTLAPWVETFLRDLFGCAQNAQDHQEMIQRYACIARIKRDFIQRRVLPVLKTLSQEDICQSPHALDHFLGAPYTSDHFAICIATWMTNPTTFHEALTWAIHYSAWVLTTLEGQRKHAEDTIFHAPQKHGGFIPLSDHAFIPPRDGFNHTDRVPSSSYAMDQAHYCLICHHRNKDSCASGMKQNSLSEGYRMNALGVALEGCPLDQKISEMNLLKRQGWPIGALAVITLHNPLVAGTGHRICWDCARACVFQTQDAVDIPAIETHILWDVLNLDWGFEIYALLTRWNPLKPQHVIPCEPSGRAVLVAGLGPAGMTLSHELLNAGHTVVAIDGLPIEPIPPSWIEKPIQRIQDLCSPLEERRTQGFGGVMEYGITARWDKNLLTILRLLLQRRTAFRCYGSIRLGGTLTLASCFERGFDHIALCLGAGRPYWPPIPGSQLPGVRIASDILMSLHAQEGFRWDTLISLGLDLPLIVIGGGLTAVDTATEAQALYIRQVERVLNRYESLEHSSDLTRNVSEAHRHRWECWLEHGRAIRAERHKAAEDHRPPAFHKLIQEWGGVHIVYRQSLQKSPAYRTNPHELRHAHAQGIQFCTDTVVEEICGSSSGVTHVRLQRQGHTHIRPCRTVLIATGLTPNVSLGSEDDDLIVEGNYFRPLSTETESLDSFTVLQRPDGRRVTFLGDLHPQFHGSVVKAMASSRKAAPQIDHWIRRYPVNPRNTKDLLETLDQETQSYVMHIRSYTGWYELVIYAPLWTRYHQPGMLYRVQGFIDTSGLKTEPIPLSPVVVDATKGCFTFWVIPCGASTHLLPHVRPLQRIALMGPSGEALPTRPYPSHILMISEGVSVIRLLQAGIAYRASGHRVTLGITGLPQDMQAHTLIQDAADHIIDLPQSSWDQSIQEILHLPSPIDYIIMAASLTRQKEIQTLWGKIVPCCGLIQAPLQCMMKGVCGQCIQRYSSEESADEDILFFACEKTVHHPQRIDSLWNHHRLNQNRALESLNDMWVQEKVLKTHPGQKLNT